VRQGCAPDPVDYRALRLHRHRSGLGEAAPNTIVVLPVLFEGRVKAVVELAAVQPFSETHLDFLDQLTDGIGSS